MEQMEQKDKSFLISRTWRLARLEILHEIAEKIEETHQCPIGFMEDLITKTCEGLTRLQRHDLYNDLAVEMAKHDLQGMGLYPNEE